MKVLISAIARRAAIFDEKDGMYLFVSPGSAWQSAPAEQFRYIFQGADDIEEIECENLKEIEKVLSVLSNAARGLTLLDVALTAPDDDDAVWATREFLKKYSEYDVRQEIDKFAFAMELPSDVAASRVGLIRSQGGSAQIFVRALEDAKSRIAILNATLDRQSRRLRLSPPQQHSLHKELVQTGIFSELARFNRDQSYLTRTLASLRPNALPEAVSPAIYDRVANQLAKVALKGHLRSMPRPRRRWGSGLMERIELLNEIVKAIVSFLTLRK